MLDQLLDLVPWYFPSAERVCAWLLRWFTLGVGCTRQGLAMMGELVVEGVKLVRWMR